MNAVPTCHFVTGPGVLARRGDVIALVFSGGDPVALDAVIAAALSASAADDPVSSARAALGGVVVSDPAQAAPYAVVVVDADGVTVLARGPLVAQVDAPAGPVEFDAHASPGGIDARIDGASRVELRWVGTPAIEPDHRYRLDDGIVPSGGVVFMPAVHVAEDHSADAVVAAAPPPPPPPPPPPTGPTPAVLAPPADAVPPVEPVVTEPPAPAAPPAVAAHSFESILLIGATADSDIVREPLPTAGQGHDHALEDDVRVEMVDGVHCVRDHFNDPNARYCSVCGISMLQQTVRLRKGPRPPLGVFVFDDGSTFVADTDYVLGRQPDTDERVGKGEARPLMVTDPQRSTSRVHADIRLKGWEVTVVDRGSANGTWLLTSGASTWTRLVPDTPTLVPTGARVRVGQRHFFYDSHHRV